MLGNRSTLGLLGQMFIYIKYAWKISTTTLQYVHVWFFFVFHLISFFSVFC